MKKGYKLCPFCGKEIKKVAIKCRYCFKFLDEKLEEPEKRECPFCMNEIGITTEKCPFCDETLENGNKQKKDENVQEKSENKQEKDFLSIGKMLLVLGILILIGLSIKLLGNHNETNNKILNNAIRNTSITQTNNKVDYKNNTTVDNNAGINSNMISNANDEFTMKEKCNEYKDDIFEYFDLDYLNTNKYGAFYSSTKNTCVGYFFGTMYGEPTANGTKLFDTIDRYVVVDLLSKKEILNCQIYDGIDDYECRDRYNEAIKEL